MLKCFGGDSMANDNSVTRDDIRILLDFYCRDESKAKIVAKDKDVEDLISRAKEQWCYNLACLCVEGGYSSSLLKDNVGTFIKMCPFPILGENSKEYACDLYVDCDDVSRDFIAQALISKKKRDFKIKCPSDKDKHGLIISCDYRDLQTVIAFLNRILNDKSLKLVGECGKEMDEYINPAIYLQSSNYDYMSLFRKTCGALFVSSYGYDEDLDKYFVYGCSFYRSLTKSIEGGNADLDEIIAEHKAVLTIVLDNIRDFCNYYSYGIVPSFELTVKGKKVRVSKEILDEAMRGFLRETYEKNAIDFPEFVYNLSLPNSEVYGNGQAGK